SWSLQNEQTMGFSGARVADVLCETDGGEKLLFLKVVEPSPLPATATAEAKRKWDRNLQSYANEVMFLSNDAIKEALASRQVVVPETLGVEAVPGKRYALLTDNLRQSFTTFAVHPAARTGEVITWLADFHGAFQGRVPSGHSLWEFGTHVHLERRPPGETDMLPASIASFSKAFEGIDPFFARPEVASLGERLRNVAPLVARHLTPRPQNQNRTTLVHGEISRAQTTSSGMNASAREGVAAIDWQWTGPGIGATDMIYLFCGSVEDEIVDNYKYWLAQYHNRLADESYSFDDFYIDFKAATLDYARWVFAYRLVGDTPEKFRQRAEKVDASWHPVSTWAFSAGTPQGYVGCFSWWRSSSPKQKPDALSASSDGATGSSLAAVGL
ncbi:unnamed protein product, partial [Symbiodinium microadriaticum]